MRSYLNNQIEINELGLYIENEENYSWEELKDTYFKNYHWVMPSSNSEWKVLFFHYLDIYSFKDNQILFRIYFPEGSDAREYFEKLYCYYILKNQNLLDFSTKEANKIVGRLFLNNVEK